MLKLPDTYKLPVLPLSDAVVLPGMVVPVELDPEVQAALDAARAEGEERVVAVPRIQGTYAPVGVLASIEQVGRLPGGAQAVVIRAICRVRVGQGVLGPNSALWVEATRMEESPVTEKTRQAAASYKGVVISILRERGAWQVIDSIQSMNDPSALADTAGYAPYLSLEQKLWLLETPDIDARLARLEEWAKAHLAELEVAERISQDVREGMERAQREYFLRQQLAAIRKELGEEDVNGSEDYRARIEASSMPESAKQAALREVARLEKTTEMSPEAGWIRTWLDTLLGLPWGIRTEDQTDLLRAREILDQDHYGLSDVKDRIIEFLAVRARRAARGRLEVQGRGAGAVLALVGPPGVGKTSLGESIASSLGRRFVRVSLGGVRDEAEIRGHRRTYLGALPGRIARALGDAGSMNPVILLDEVDKLGSDYRGDPAAALLEVLDPAQNHTFRDHYLEVELDLSDVLFVATANMTETIPEVLLDRMEVVRLDGYTEEEKLQIALRHLLPRQMEAAAMEESEVEVSQEAILEIIRRYTREAGVRELERSLARVLRKVARALAEGREKPPVRVGPDRLASLLGKPRYIPATAERPLIPGVATGLAVTGAGGDVIFVEAAFLGRRGEPRLVLTGQLGEVMRESAQIALSYLRSHADRWGLDAGILSGELHVHVPAGAVPKDGPSAGVTMAVALASLASGRPVRPEVAMTGEVTLAGRILPVGGIKQKVLAAKRAGVSLVFVPAQNEADVAELPADLREGIEVRLVSELSSLLDEALLPVEEAKQASSDHELAA